MGEGGVVRAEVREVERDGLLLAEGLLAEGLLAVGLLAEGLLAEVVREVSL